MVIASFYSTFTLFQVFYTFGPTQSFMQHAIRRKTGGPISNNVHQHVANPVITTEQSLMDATIIDNSKSSTSSLLAVSEPITFSLLEVEQDIANLQLQAEKNAIEKEDNYAMNALFVNIDEHPDPRPCEIYEDDQFNIYSLPPDLPPGCLLRIGPNGATKDEGFLDGDGMIHCITIPPPVEEGKEELDQKRVPTYSSTYVETNGRKLEKESKLKGDNYKFRGTLGAAPNGWPMLQSLVQNGIEFQTLSCQKDTCNTAMARSGERILALMEQSRPSEINVHKDGTVKSVDSMLTLDDAIEDAPITGGSFGAHGRTDPVTGERVHVSYTSNKKPFVKVDTFDKDWKLSSSIGVDIPAPIMVHDCAMTENYVVVCDFPLTVRPRRFLLNQFPVEYEPNHGARIGLTPRSNKKAKTFGKDKEKIIWFDVDAGVVLHLANAYENDDGNVVVHGFKSIPKGDSSYILDYSSSFLHEWIVNPKSGEVLFDHCLNPDEIVEFPAVEDRVVTKKSEYCYGMKVTSICSTMEQFKTPKVGVLLDSVLKFSLVDNEKEGIMSGDVVGRFALPTGWHFVSEPTIVSKIGTNGGHYVLLIATEVPIEKRSVDHVTCAVEKNLMRSQLIVLDGDDVSAGPVSIVDLPNHVNYGLHSLFVPWNYMK